MPKRKIKYPETFEKSLASHEKSKFWSPKNLLTPREVILGSNTVKYLFDCNCGHEIEKTPLEIKQGIWCPFCGIPCRALCRNDDCVMCKKHSFEVSPKAEFWSPKNMDDEGDPIFPRDVLLNTKKKFIFDCNCGHEICTRLDQIARGHWCKYCCTNSIVLCGDINCIPCFDKSFASQPMVRLFRKDNNIEPHKIFKGTNVKYLFDCDTCDHIVEKSPVRFLMGEGCQYCAIPSKILCDDIDCLNCHHRSLAGHERAKYWSKENKKTSRQVLLNSHTKYKFICEKGHKFKMAPAIVNRGCWCPLCKYKTQRKIFEFLKKEYINVIDEYKTEWCKNSKTNRYLPFDFLLKGLKIIIELDGAQHFTQIENWGAPEDAYKRDLYKMNCANENGFSVIRILQEDVLYDRIDWKKNLKEKIEKLKRCKKEIKNIFIYNGTEYDHFDRCWYD